MKGLAALLAGLVLVACGGGGGSAGTAPFGSAASAPGPGASAPQPPAAAADISLVLSSTSINNSGSQTVTATVTAVDASRNALAGVPVSVSVDNNAVALVSAARTDAAGKVTATVSIGADRSNRVVSVRATSGSLEQVAAFQVIGARLDATLIPSVVTPGSSGNKIQYRLVDVNSNPMGSQAIVVSAPGFADVTGSTDANGTYDYVYTAPGTSGSVTFTGAAGGVTAVSVAEAQSGAGAKPNAVGTILTRSISANPSVVSVNSETTNNRSELRALFLGANNAPIVNVRARFELPDPNSIGGTLSTQANTVYSDVNGVAQSAYIPGSRSSPTDGVIVRVCFSNSDFLADDPATATREDCPSEATTTLTVTAEALAVTIGTDNRIETGPSGLTYIKKFVVLVVDASGQAKADVQVTPSIDLVQYLKGYYDGPGNWNRNAPSALNPVPVAGSIGFTGSTCLNEDINRNGVLEQIENNGLVDVVDGEAVPDNGNGVLDPRKSDVAITMVGGNRTNASGTAILQIEYPKNVATWIDFLITVAASGVAGTEGRATWAGRLGAEAGEFDAEVPPSFVVSPYGLGLTDGPNGDGVIDCRDPD